MSEVETSQLLQEAQHELGVRAQIITDLQDERARSRQLLDKAHRMVQRLRDEAQIINAQTQAIVRALMHKQGLEAVLISEDNLLAVEFKVLDRDEHEATSGARFVLRDMSEEESSAHKAHIAKVKAMQAKLTEGATNKNT